MQIMVFIGFGCLMTFLRRYSYSAIAFNFFVSAFVIVWAILGIGLFQQVMELRTSGPVHVVLRRIVLIRVQLCVCCRMHCRHALLGVCIPTGKH